MARSKLQKVCLILFAGAVIAGAGFNHPAVAQQTASTTDATKGRWEIGAGVANTGNGVAITQVYPGGAAHKAQLQAGDILKSIGGHEIVRVGDASNFLRTFQGGKVRVMFSRNGETKVSFLDPVIVGGQPVSYNSAASLSDRSANSGGAVLYGNPNAKNKLEMYFSVGCNHCLDFLDQNIQALKTQADRGSLFIEFVELPGAVSAGPDKNAQGKDAAVSFILHCVSQRRVPVAYLSSISAVIDAAKTNIIAQGDWRKGHPVWQNWVHLNPSQVASKENMNFNFITRAMVDQTKLEVSQCNGDFGKVAQSRYDRLRWAHIDGIPAYFLNGKKVEASVVSTFLRNGAQAKIRSSDASLDSEQNRLADYSKYCEEGHAPSCHKLGQIYALGAEVELNGPRAVRYYTKACDSGIAQSCDALAAMLEYGLGVPQDAMQATSLFTKACNGGVAEACHALGYKLEYGIGVTQNEKAAISFYTKACNGGIVKICDSLGVRYRYGKGVALSEQQAASFFAKGCDGGDFQSCHSIGFMYEQGEGVSQDKSRALSLYTKACDGGFADSCGARDRLQKGVKLEHLANEQRNLASEKAEISATIEKTDQSLSAAKTSVKKIDEELKGINYTLRNMCLKTRNDFLKFPLKIRESIIENKPKLKYMRNSCIDDFSIDIIR